MATKTKTMKITIKKRPGKRTGLGTGWTEGTVGPYRFQALVFPEHADNEDWELGRSRISKLWIGYGNQTIFEWDRGLSKAAEMVVEHQAVNLLKDNLARLVFGATVAKAGGKRRKAAGGKKSRTPTWVLNMQHYMDAENAAKSKTKHKRHKAASKASDKPSKLGTVIADINRLTK